MKVFILLCLLCYHSYSVANVCTGKVNRVQLTGVGAVELISNDIYGSLGGRTICNVSSVRQGVSVEACKGWYSLILSSLAQDKEIQIQYATLNCKDVLLWSQAIAPHMLSNK